jgi:predicted ATP-binding protein involved in virulence
LAVATLFDARAVLQNPEVVLLRQEPAARTALQNKLIQIMLLDSEAAAFEQTPSALLLRTPFGGVPINSLSDGYRSTVQWLLDLFSWLIYAKRWPTHREPAGILLIDEIEQHLHPRWQRHIMRRLTEQLPRMQIIATTHTPLIASSMADVKSSGLLRLIRDDRQEPEAVAVVPSELSGKRADQVLTEFFDLATSRNPGSNADLELYVQLKSLPNRTPAEQQRFEELAARVEPGLQFGETDVERKVVAAVTTALTNLLKQPPPEEFNIEAKRQLRDLFGANDD